MDEQVKFGITLTHLDFMDVIVDKGERVEIVPPSTSSIYQNSRDSMKRAFDCGHFLIIIVSFEDGSKKELQCHGKDVKIL